MPPRPKTRHPWLSFIPLVIAVLVIVWFVLAYRAQEPAPQYGLSFSKLHSEQLQLDWRETYDAILNDLQPTRLRLMAHWPEVESADGAFNFEALDYQMQKAEESGAKVILAVGRKVPVWPECHVPGWAQELSHDERESALFDYMRAVVERYRDSSALLYWQVENEAFLHYALEHCGDIQAEEMVAREVAFVKETDPNHLVVVTDSGEFGRWYQAYRVGDVFGTSMYLYIHYDNIGYFRYPIGASFFRIKRNLVELAYGKKPVLLIELAAEPWLTQPIVDTPIEFQMERMGLDKFQEMVEYGRDAGFEEQYLWGAEWWYWLKKRGETEHWDYAQGLLSASKENAGSGAQ